MADFVVSGNMVVASVPTTGINSKTSFGAITPGQVVYNATNTTVGLANATSGTTAAVAGISLTSTVSGQLGNIMTTGNWFTGTTVSPGVALFLSKNNGALCPAADLTSGMTAVVVGMSLSGGTATFVNTTAIPASISN